MPMIDFYATPGTFSDQKGLTQKAAELMMEVEKVPNIPMFRNNTAGFFHELDNDSISNANGDSNYVRVQVLTNKDALSREQQVELVEKMTDLVVQQSGNDELKNNTWVLLTEATAGGWGLWGHAHTNEELVAAAKKEIESLSN